MHIGEFKQSKYLKQSDIPEAVLWTIQNIAKENVAKENQVPKERCIVYFRESAKGMVFNATNLNRAAKALNSEDTDDWIGKKLVVYVDPNVEMGGEIVGGLRVRAPRVPAQAPAPVMHSEQEPAPRARAPVSRSEAMSGIEGMDDDIPFLFDTSAVCDTLGMSKSRMRIKHGQKVLSILQANAPVF